MEPPRVKLCLDCRFYFVDQRYPNSRHTEHCCAHPKTAPSDTGRRPAYPLCFDQRHGGPCEGGKLWEPKP